VVGRLGADCTTPIGVHARVADRALAMTAFVGLPDGSEWVREALEADAEAPAEAGSEMAERLLAAGAAELLERAARA
jgi:hydroxymethylbilane synthase